MQSRRNTGNLTEGGAGEERIVDQILTSSIRGDTNIEFSPISAAKGGIQIDNSVPGSGVHGTRNSSLRQEESVVDSR